MAENVIMAHNLAMFDKDWTDSWRLKAEMALCIDWKVSHPGPEAELNARCWGQSHAWLVGFQRHLVACLWKQTTGRFCGSSLAREF